VIGVLNPTDMPVYLERAAILFRVAMVPAACARLSVAASAGRPVLLYEKAVLRLIHVPSLRRIERVCLAVCQKLE
jgi:hypothetical protein